MFLKDPDTKRPSVSVTAFVAGFAVATFKLLASGITVGAVTLSPFTGVDFAAVVGALGALYASKRFTKESRISDSKEEG